MPAALRAGSRRARARDDLARFVTLVRTFAAVYSPIGGRAARGQSRHARLRTAFEQLGLTYLKLGQFLAMRFDILPAEVCRELEKLFESVSPVPFEAAREAVERELGAPLERLYSQFDREPLASASVAQVHTARLPDGTPVAVKVQRPGIERIFLADMRNLWRAASLGDRIGLSGGLNLQEIADGFIAWTLRELDFENEARTAERLRESALEFETVPWIDARRTRKRVMTMQFIDGISLNELTKTFVREGEAGVRRRLPGAQLSTLLHHLAQASLHQLFGTGFFHGDPHPGNILIARDNTIAFIDFGIYGELTPYFRGLMRGMIEAIATGDIHRAFRCWAAQGDITAQTDAEAFEREAKDTLTRWFRGATRPDAPVEDRHLGRYSGECLELIRKHKVRMSFATLLFWRALVALDSATQRFPEHFELVAELKRFFAELRGSPLDQLLAVSGDEIRARSLAKLADPAGRRYDVATRVLDGQLAVFVSESEDRVRTRAANRAARLASLALVGAAAVVALHG